MSTTLLPRGHSLKEGRFVVNRALGQGSQGETYEAVDKRDGRLVAIKRFQIRGAKAWKDVELAEREARVLERLDHAGLPAHVDHFEEDGALYLAMEKIEGQSVARLAGTFREDDVLEFLRDAGAVLEYLHARRPPVIHRDIKPGNVLRRPDGSFAIVDFGSVRDTLKPEGGSTVIGTFGYMAPEQFQGRALPATDVYAVAATALVMLTGKPPDELPHDGLRIDVRKAIGGIARPELVQALERMVEPNPDQRPRAVVVVGEPTPGRPPPPPSTRQRRPSRQAERVHHHPGGPRAMPGLPMPVRVMFFLGLIAAQLAVFAALRVVVPMVLSVLSIFFGSGLSRAAARVSRGGERAGATISAARRRLSREPRAAAPSGPRRRVSVPRSRVGVDADAEADAEAELAAESEAHAAREARR